MTWTLLVPMCALDTAKSRLSPLGDEARRELALAMFLDTLTAAALPSVDVRVVTPDPAVGRAVKESALPVSCQSSPGSGLNADLRAAMAKMSPGPMAILPGDLPALRPSALARALVRARNLERVVASDAAGSGTTFLAAVDARRLRPAFGAGSLYRHVRQGARLLPTDPFLAHDVDVPADLPPARALGVGPRTRAVLNRRQLLGTRRDSSQQTMTNA